MGFEGRVEKRTGSAGEERKEPAEPKAYGLGEL